MNTTSNESQQRNRTLDVIKGICILLVIITHFRWTDRQRPAFLFPYWIDMAIPVFMLITGYVNSLSYEKRKTNSLKLAYSPRNIIGKLIRYTLPFLPVFIFEEIADSVLKGENHSLIKMISVFIQGGHGPGAYYYPVMIQIVLMLPLIWYITKKYREKGVAMTFLLNLMFEIGKNIVGMNDGIYRLLAFRYIFVLALGCYIFYSGRIKKIYYVIIAFIGFAYLTVYNYTALAPIVMTKWTNTSMIAVLWIFPFAKWLINRNALKNKALETLGKASYHIFFVQMVYYSYAAGTLYERIQNPVLQLTIHLMVCCSLGLLYYYILTPITRWIVDRVGKG